MIAKKYSLPKEGGTKLNKQISRVRRCNPWLQNRAVPSQQLKLLLQLNPQGALLARNGVGPGCGSEEGQDSVGGLRRHRAWGGAGGRGRCSPALAEIDQGK